MLKINLPTKKLSELAEKLGSLLELKNKAYGSSFENTSKILSVLYPEGIPVDQYARVGLIIRILDKLNRIATNNDPTGEDPFMDIAGYGILGASIRKDK